jgi:hypothetical protein
VVAAGAPRRTDLAQDLVLAVGRCLVGQIGQPHEDGLELLLGLARALAERLDLRREVAHARDRVAGVLARPLGLGDPL